MSRDLVGEGKLSLCGADHDATGLKREGLVSGSVSGDPFWVVGTCGNLVGECSAS